MTTETDPPVDDLDEGLSIDERAAIWLDSLRAAAGRKEVAKPRHQVKAFLAAASLNPDTAEAAKKLQSRLSFAASVIAVPVRAMAALVEAYCASIGATSAPVPAPQPANSPISPPPEFGGVVAAINALRKTASESGSPAQTTTVDSSVVAPANASEAK